MSVFECVYLRGNLFRRIGRQDGAFCLKDNRSFVVMFVYVMDRNTGLPFAGGNDRLDGLLLVSKGPIAPALHQFPSGDGFSLFQGLGGIVLKVRVPLDQKLASICLLYTSDAADEL